MVVKAVSNFSYHDLSYICVSLSQYLEFVGKLFCSVLCTYSRVFYTPVPQSFVCDTSEGVNLVLKHIYSHCRCITHKTLRHRCAKDFIICIKYGTKGFIQKFQVLVSKSLKWWLKLLATFHIMICHIFGSLSVNTWNLWVNSFVPYFVHIVGSFTPLCLKVLCVIHLKGSIWC